MMQKISLLAFSTLLFCQSGTYAHHPMDQDNNPDPMRTGLVRTDSEDDRLMERAFQRAALDLHRQRMNAVNQEVRAVAPARVAEIMARFEAVVEPTAKAALYQGVVQHVSPALLNEIGFARHDTPVMRAKKHGVLGLRLIHMECDTQEKQMLRDHLVGSQFIQAANWLQQAVSSTPDAGMADLYASIGQLYLWAAYRFPLADYKTHNAAKATHFLNIAQLYLHHIPDPQTKAKMSAVIARDGERLQS